MWPEVFGDRQGATSSFGDTGALGSWWGWARRRPPGGGPERVPTGWSSSRLQEWGEEAQLPTRHPSSRPVTQAVSLPPCCHTAKAAASQPPPARGKLTWEAWLFERAPHPEAQASGELQRRGTQVWRGVHLRAASWPPGLAPHPALSSPHCQTKRGVRAADGGWTPGWTRRGDWGCRPPARCPKPFHLPSNPHPRALVVHVADCGPAHSPSGRAGAGCPPTNTAPAGDSLQGPGHCAPPPSPAGGTHPAMCRPV